MEIKEYIYDEKNKMTFWKVNRRAFDTTSLIPFEKSKRGGIKDMENKPYKLCFANGN